MVQVSYTYLRNARIERVSEFAGKNRMKYSTLRLSKKILRAPYKARRTINLRDLRKLADRQTAVTRKIMT
jgi:hypothetical protein